jgi:hypothetical protein
MTGPHNIEYEKNASDEIKERNKKLLNAYNYIIITIDRMQGFISDEYLRLRIESEMFKDPKNKSTILQCTTPWCVISLGCDSSGCYNIVYSVDFRIQEMIGPDMASGIIRRVYEYTQGDMALSVRIGSLNQDCVDVFNQLIEEEKNSPIHNLIARKLN